MSHEKMVCLYAILCLMFANICVVLVNSSRKDRTSKSSPSCGTGQERYLLRIISLVNSFLVNLFKSSRLDSFILLTIGGRNGGKSYKNLDVSIRIIYRY